MIWSTNYINQSVLPCMITNFVTYIIQLVQLVYHYWLLILIHKSYNSSFYADDLFIFWFYQHAYFLNFFRLYHVITEKILLTVLYFFMTFFETVIFLLKKLTILFSSTNFIIILQVLFSYTPNFLDLFLLKNSHTPEFSINISLRIFQIFICNSIFIQNYWNFSPWPFKEKNINLKIHVMVNETIRK